MIELLYYHDASGRRPFIEWHSQLRDKLAKSLVTKRLAHLELGNFGDSSPVGEGVIELRVHVGAGYRVYCARHGKTIVLLLTGGDKRSQAVDIRLAQMFWAEWKKGQNP